MGYIWVSAQSCSQQELFHLTELFKTDRDMRIILSCEPPTAGGSQVAVDGKIMELFARLAIKPNLKGYRYLKASLRLCMKDREELNGITKRLYPSIARKYATTVGNVEHAIRHAIQTAWDSGGTEMQKAVFGYCRGCGKRPTNAEFITHVLAYLEKMNAPLYS